MRLIYSARVIKVTNAQLLEVECNTKQFYSYLVTVAQIYGNGFSFCD